MTLDDVARRARVSTATVSRVLNDAPGVRAATRARVMRAVEELNYTPNLNARSLAGGEPRTLGMVVSNIGNPFFLDIFRAVEAGARQRGFDVLVANTDYESARLASSIATIVGWRVAGLRSSSRRRCRRWSPRSPASSRWCSTTAARTASST